IRLNGNNRFRVWDSYAPPEANKLRDWSVPASARLNATGLVSTTLTADGSALAPGTYFISAIDSRASIGVSRYVVVVSNVNLALKRTETEALVWVTDLKTGKPVADQALTLRNQNSIVVGTGKSDKDGVWRTTFARTNSYDPLLVTSENAEGVVIAAAGTEWADGIRPYDFNLPTEYQSQDYYSNLYTDRAIYRPGQSVYFKGIIRSDNDASYSLPDVKNAPIIVFDSQGKQVYSQTLALSSYGTFNGAVALADSASTGSYNIQLQLGQDPHKYYANASFQVAEYKAPEFQVQVKTDRDEYFNGDKIQVNSGSTYFFGGAVADAKVTWRLLSDDLFFRPDNVKGFWDFTDYDFTQRRVTGGVIREGKGKTDSSGTFKVEVPADLKDIPLSQNFTIETEVVDINNQSVSSRATVPVHKGKFYIGLHPQKYVGTANQEQGVDIITVDSKGASVPNQALALSFYQREWYSVRAKDLDGNFYWKSAYTDTLESQVNVSTDAQGQASAKFTPKKGGVYRIVATGQDASGNAIRSATYLWVTTRDFVNWRVDNNDRIDLVADKKQYTVGETAEVLIPAPFAGAEALLTIERGSIREVRRLTLQGNSESVKIPILSDYAPNVYVSVMLVKGRGADSPTAQFKIGYTNLSVATTEKQLTVKLTPDKTKYAPRDNADFTVEAVNSKGQPVAAEFSVALVDKAIQSLADETSPSPLNAFYGQRGLGVQTSATLNRSVERINQTLTPEAKGGGGGAQLQAPVRRDFRDTAFWKADLVTDGNGRARVSIPLPDNLTTWNLTAKGVTLNTQVGDARTDIISTRDLLVRPVTPRFFVPGDKTRLEAVVNNNSDKDINADVKLDAQGLALAGNATQPLTIRAHDKAKVSWDTTTSAVENVVVTMSVNGGGLNDAVELTLPVKRPSSVETVGTAGQVDTTIAEKIQLPGTLDPSAGNLQIQIAPSLAAASRDSLNYLEAFDYDCAEQTVSKFFPNVVTYNALKKLGIDRPELGANLRVNVNREVQRLYALQNQDGGWGWWVGESRPMITAYALLALDNARQNGFAVDDNVMRRAEQYLTRYLDQPLDVKLGYAANERAFVLFTLTEMGRNYTSRAVNLFDQRATMAQYGKAYLMMTLLKLKLPQAQTLQSELAATAVLDATGAHWEEKTNDYWTMNTNTRTTALVIMAFARNNPRDATLTNAVRWLMLARQQGHWKSTQETAWAVLALTDYMVGTGELNANYSFTVNLNGKQIGDGKVDKSNVDRAKTLTVGIKDLLAAQANDLALNKNGDGKMYYSAFLNYYLPVENLPALNRGLIVGRQYEAVDPQTLKPTGKLVTSAKIGDYVQVRLALIAPTDMNYLVLEDYLPAGFEAVDTTLKTSSVAAQGPVLKDQNAPKTGDIYARWFMPYWGFWAHSEIRDDRVAVFATYLGRGVYEYTYTIRASVAGEFRTLPARAWEMYFPDVFGRSAGATFVVAGN
ncbi:MAG TPA: alpha-2-macroglobulin family protein, partial [Anaerolineae bacterium]